MKFSLRRLAPLAIVVALSWCAPATANDVDGPNDCGRPSHDFGDAPEGIDAYPGVIGRFPTCVSGALPAGTQQAKCPPISTLPGAAAGYVRHENPAGIPPYWLGCSGALAPAGIDTEDDGKVNLSGVGPSDCNALVTVDNSEPSWLIFGQDEAYGDTDAGLAAAPALTVCQPGTITFQVYNCSAAARTVTLNVLVDWNEDGDWNDNFECPGFPALTCSYEWAIKNVFIPLAPGCNTITSPTFLVGPNAGRGWMRVTISDAPAPNDFPWFGTAGVPGGFLQGGETEDYPVRILAGPGPGCSNTYQDWGDAPENLPAYASGIVGMFPTCLTPGPIASMNLECGTASGPLPGPAGFVRHDAVATNPVKFWLGCPLGAGIDGVDGENDGKVNEGSIVGVGSRCDPAVLVDGFESSWFDFGQDEVYGDTDASLGAPPSFPACDLASVAFRAFNCGDLPREVFLNILVDWNEDGDWMDNVACAGITQCAKEWAVQNVLVPLDPGCNARVSPLFRVGSHPGQGWMRITITDVPVPNDFPWNGSISTASHAFAAGETEDYPVRIEPSLVGVDPLPPGEFAFAKPMPNPARARTAFRWSQPTAARVSLSIYDILGRRLVRLVDRELPAGEHDADWNFRREDGSAVPPGVYMARIRIGEHAFTARVIRSR